MSVSENPPSTQARALRLDELAADVAIVAKPSRVDREAWEADGERITIFDPGNVTQTRWIDAAGDAWVDLEGQR